ncbi:MULTISPECIES: hypothetical protein [Pseudomonas]|uniref:hypothetical protein n=1 Tax=Pseudomonas TaxID=286 RepID=UPI000DA85827|nr:MULTISPECIES: hypothetical protein [Pseudomonas]MDW3712698.1 hypothetical protein [Pseudomonas sp. 2023EL-01195]PZE13396.1 hypothetical protein DMX10_10725 [Pseudomonas sp. 57B-090624]GJN49044.1 hypothetical protein TUM20249_50300 [Pseudomonas tohonis]
MPTAKPIGHHDEISLVELALRALKFYQRFGRLLLLLALLAAFAVAAWIANRPLYGVSALLEVPKVTLEEWRQAQSFLWDKRWVDHAFGDHQSAAAPDRMQLRNRALNPEFWLQNVRYRSSLNRDDARDIPVAQIQNSTGLGLEFTLRVSDEEQASQTINALARQVREAFLANSLIDLARTSQAALDHRPQLKLDVLKAEFDIEQNRQRIADMRQLLERYPDLRHLETSTLFSVSDGGGKYLSPLPQIVALESTISELQAKARAAQRELDKLDWTERLLAGVDDTIRNATSGEDILDKLKSNREQVLAASAQQNSAAREAAEDINIKLAQAESRQQAIGIKTRSAISTMPVMQRNPLVMGGAAFVLTFVALSILLALHVALSRELDVLTWLPRSMRRWLIVDKAL